MVEGDLERSNERVEEAEAKIRDLETHQRDLESKVKETEAVTVRNSEKEEQFESKMSKLQEEFKTQDTRAEFAERSVDKLEGKLLSTIRNRQRISFFSRKISLTSLNMGDKRPPIFKIARR